MGRVKVCKDCVSEGVTSHRPAPHPGPRCATHHRERRKGISEARWASYIAVTYNWTPEMYWALYKHQEGRCAWCQRATGKARRLSLDHDHSCCPGKISCGQCVRGLLCSTCNKALGHFRDSPYTVGRGVHYLNSPPANYVPKPKLWKRRKQ